MQPRARLWPERDGSFPFHSYPKLTALVLFRRPWPPMRQHVNRRRSGLRPNIHQKPLTIRVRSVQGVVAVNKRHYRAEWKQLPGRPDPHPPRPSRSIATSNKPRRPGLRSLPARNTAASRSRSTAGPTRGCSRARHPAPKETAAGRFPHYSRHPTRRRSIVDPAIAEPRSRWRLSSKSSPVCSDR
jgi:hypothetical protein